MADAAEELAGVTLVDLYAEYPTFEVDVDREQQRLREHDAIVFLHPSYWYSTLAILKEWQDLVLEYGFAYGSSGKSLQGKIFFSALSAGRPAAAYRAEGYNHFTIRQLMAPLEQTANLCGMIYLPPFALFGARAAVEEGRSSQHVRDWIRLLTALQDDRVDLTAASDLPHLNDHLDEILTGDL